MRTIHCLAASAMSMLHKASGFGHILQRAPLFSISGIKAEYTSIFHRSVVAVPQVAILTVKCSIPVIILVRHEIKSSQAISDDSKRGRDSANKLCSILKTRMVQKSLLVSQTMRYHEQRDKALKLLRYYERYTPRLSCKKML